MPGSDLSRQKPRPAYKLCYSGLQIQGTAGSPPGTVSQLYGIFSKKATVLLLIAKFSFSFPFFAFSHRPLPLLPFSGGNGPSARLPRLLSRSDFGPAQSLSGKEFLPAADPVRISARRGSGSCGPDCMIRRTPSFPRSRDLGTAATSRTSLFGAGRDRTCFLCRSVLKAVLRAVQAKCRPLLTLRAARIILSWDKSFFVFAPPERNEGLFCCQVFQFMV